LPIERHESLSLRIGPERQWRDQKPKSARCCRLVFEILRSRKVPDWFGALRSRCRRPYIVGPQRWPGV